MVSTFSSTKQMLKLMLILSASLFPLLVLEGGVQELGFLKSGSRKGGSGRGGPGRPVPGRPVPGRLFQDRIMKDFRKDLWKELWKGFDGEIVVLHRVFAKIPPKILSRVLSKFLSRASFGQLPLNNCFPDLGSGGWKHRGIPAWNGGHIRAGNSWKDFWKES